MSYLYSGYQRMPATAAVPHAKVSTESKVLTALRKARKPLTMGELKKAVRSDDISVPRTVVKLSGLGKISVVGSRRIAINR